LVLPDTADADSPSFSPFLSEGLGGATTAVP
jgi:hypothetical protein